MTVGIFRIYKCSACGLEHTYPVSTDWQLKNFYANYTDIRAKADVVSLNAERNLKSLVSYGYEKSNTILDFGSGDSYFVKVAGEKCFGIDFKRTEHERVKQQFSDLPVQSFDFITLWGVLEHLNKPVETIKELKRKLNPGGRIVLTTVDAESVIPYFYKPVEHLTYWTVSAFVEMFKQCDLKMLDKQPYVMLQRSEIYVGRLLSRTPEIYRVAFNDAIKNLPNYVEVPTNETFVVAESI